ncbi:MAG: amino acid adenylation domain-containing protein [Clostridiales bacterium]|nr:amino acid adenylation domain-containing protein [Clostridiales bacterium]
MPADQEQHPLSTPQKGIWYTEKFYPGTSIAGVSGTMRLKAPVDFSLLEQALNLLIENNDSLRLRVCMADNEARQYVAPHAYQKFEVKDFSDSEEGDLRTWETMMTTTPLFAENAALFRAVLLKIDEKTCGYFLSLHHLISDAWSMVLIGDEVMRYYLDLQKGMTEGGQKPSYLDFLREERGYLESERRKKDAAFWREQFETLPEMVGIKARKSRKTNTAAARKTYVLPRRLCNRVREYIANSGVSMFVTFMGAFIIYLNRITGCEDTVIGVPVFGRYTPKMKETLGMFVSTTPFRASIDTKETYAEFNKALTKRWMSALRHQRFPIDEILHDVRSRFGDVERIYDIVFSYQNAKFEPSEDSLNQGATWHFSAHQRESLAIHINEREGDGKITLDYDYLTEIFHVKDIDALHDHYTRLLWHALDAPQTPIKKIEMVSEKEKARILKEFNNTDADFPQERSMLSFFEERAARTPKETALLFNGSSLTYGELNARANALAWRLREKGVARESVVALMLRRSFEMMTGILGIWKAGGAYLPIDPDYPEERVAYMLEDGGARVLLTASPVARRPAAFTGEVLQIDLIPPDETLAAPSDPPSPLDAAYVIYTSGSTGQAKGVLVEHRALVNRINWKNRKYPLTPNDVILQKTTYTFDVSVWELVWWFFAGVKMVFLEPEAERHPDRLIDAIASYKITTMHFVPSMLSAFLGFAESHRDSQRLASLRYVFASGEALTPQHVNRFNSLAGPVSGARLYNLYGPTEAAIDVSYYDCPGDAKQRVIPIGKPIENIQLYIVDRHMNLQPIGIPGELCIGGVGLARGYLNKPALTAEKFVDNPFSPGQRLYMTGDLTRWFPKGDIEYLGRIDRQIKLRGFRIELGDIQYHLEQHPSIKEAVVVCSEGAKGDKYLAAYYVAQEEVPAVTLRDFLAKRLPEYMVPAYFIKVERIPLFSNGKANAALLPAPTSALSALPAREIVAPRNQVEAFVMRAWSEVLEMEDLSVTDDFFKLGGDSINAIDMVCRMPKPINVSKLYEHPVLEDFARCYDEKGDGRLLTLLAGEEGAEKAYILCPYGGGGPYSYLDLANLLFSLDPACCVYSVNLPGHDFGAQGGENFLSVRDAATLILRESAQRIRGKITVYTHCVGAALGVELVRLFELAGAGVKALFIGAILPAAHVAVYGWFFDPWMFFNDARLMKFLNTLGLAAESIGGREREMMMKAFRHDVRAYYRYFAWFMGQKGKKLSTPVYTVLGEDDRLTRRQKGSWAAISEKPMTVYTLAAARHYFTKTHAGELAEFLTQPR